MTSKNRKISHLPGFRKKTKKSSGRQDMGETYKLLHQALAFHQKGRLPEAEALFRQMLQIVPSHPEALLSSGLLACQSGLDGIALELIRHALRCRPDYHEAHVNLGIVLKAQGRLDEAAASFQRALALKPNFAVTHYNLGNVLADQGKLEEAAASFRRAITWKPDFAEAYSNLGITLTDQGKLEEAAASFRKALTLRPNSAEIHCNLGKAYTDQGRLDEAAASFRRALALKPDSAETHSNLGVTLTDQGKLEEAVASFRKALALKQDYVEAYNNLGITLTDQGKLDEAMASFRLALTLKPDYAEALNNLGNALKDQGRLEEAIASYRQAVTLKPDYFLAHSNLLFCLNYLPQVSQQEINEQSLQWGERLAEKLTEYNWVHLNGKEISRRLKIGYVSSDFRSHSVASFVEPLLMAHNRERVEIYCYANVKKTDESTGRFQAASDHWRSIAGMTDSKAAEWIQEDRIDILVDLGGHTGENRLPVFARKPAPIQVSWLGYPNTTGMRAMDYRFTDIITDPPGDADRLYIEELIRLEHGFLCYQPDTAAPEPGPPPCIERDYVTFGSFNNLPKVTPEVVRVWAGILLRVPRSRLLLKTRPLADTTARERILRRFVGHGISEERIELHGWLPGSQEHLKLYHQIDIGLDPFPYNGTTTTCEALWMGVPVVTLRGERHAARVGASIMHQVGLEELVARGEDEYMDLAVTLARDQERLQTLRSGLRQKLRGSPLLNEALFAATVEDAYRRMWRKWCEAAGTGT